MKKILLQAILLCIAPLTAVGQATGNAIFNDNNRFKNNWSYQNINPATMNYNSTAYSNFNVVNNLTLTAEKEMTVTLNVLHNIKPSSFLAIFHINQAADSVRTAERIINERYKKLVGACIKLGILDADIYKDVITMVPIYEKDKNKKKYSKNKNEKPIGVEIQNNIHIKYSNSSLLDKIIAAAAESEIYDLVKVEYFTDSNEYALEKMQSKALQAFNKKLEYYKKLGIHLDTCYRTVNETKSAFFPIDQYKAYKPIAVSSVEFETADVTSPAPSVYYTESATVFYNQLVQKGFDVIINPNTTPEPKIQYIYTLTVKFNRTQPVITNTKTVDGKNSTFIITPQGTLLQVP